MGRPSQMESNSVLLADSTLQYMGKSVHEDRTDCRKLRDALVSPCGAGSFEVWVVQSSR